MSKDTIWAESRIAEIDASAERKLRSVFVGSAGLSFLIVAYLLFLCMYWHLPALVYALFLPMLFWSLIVTVYAFRSLWDVSRKRSLLLHEMAKRDSVTGAYSHEHLRSKLKEERVRAFETGKAAAFACVKILGMGHVNTTYGHTAGNIVLRELAKIIMDSVPPECTVARLGGQDFAVLMPATPVQAGQDTMTIVWKRIREYQLDLGGRGRITGMDASIGVGAYPCDADSPAEITQVVQSIALTDQPEPGVHISGERKSL